MKYVFIILTIASILSQVPHAYTAIEWNSHLTGWLKRIQAGVFCAIISVAIFSFVIIGEQGLSLSGVFVEIVFNIYYYGNEQKERKWKDKLGKNWFQFFLAILMPVLIYVFSHILKDSYGVGV